MLQSLSSMSSAMTKTAITKSQPIATPTINQTQISAPTVSVITQAPVLLAQLPAAPVQMPVQLPVQVPVKPPVVAVPPPKVENNKNSQDAIDKIIGKFDKAFTEAEKNLIKKYLSGKSISLDTVKKIAALKPGDPKALLILQADPAFKKLGFAEQFKVLGALNKITTIYNDAMKELKAALKKDGFSDAQITQIVDLMTQYMIEFALGTMEGLEDVDDTVSTGIISSTPLQAALQQLGYILRDNKNFDDIIKELKDLLKKPEKKEDKKEPVKPAPMPAPMPKTETVKPVPMPMSLDVKKTAGMK